MPDQPLHTESNLTDTTQDVVDEAIIRSIFPNPFTRRVFLKAVGTGAALSTLASFLPVDFLRSLAVEGGGALEKKMVDVAFLPITCATPMILAESQGFYKKQGLDVTLRRITGWAVVRDLAVNGEVDAAHMLIPMPLAISLGTEAKPVPFTVPALANTDGSAITLHKKHLGKVKGPQDFKGFRICIPFRYSMHNYLLRYYLASGGVDPDRDVELRVVPPPEMLANLKAGNVDGYIVAEPFNQRAVYDNTGFIFKLTKSIWDQHPCCGLTVSKKFAADAPNTFMALFRAMVESTLFCQKQQNRELISKTLAPRKYLNQPEIVIRQILTGKFANGAGEIENVPGRIGFAPYPWESMAVWILTQMKRWKHVRFDFDFKAVAREVFLATECDQVLKDLGAATHKEVYRNVDVLGKTFDPNRPEQYLASFKMPSE